MLLLRIAVVGVLAILFAWSAIRIFRVGRFKARGGTLITRNETPTWFWASVVLQCALVGGLLAFMWSLVEKWRLGF
jgi:hypothetical protein